MKPIEQWVKDAYAKRKIQLFGNFRSTDSSSGSNSDSQATDTKPDKSGAESDRDEN